MFKNNGNNKVSPGDPASPERLNRIVEGSSMEGDLVCDSNLRIDGKVKGTVRTNSRLVIGENGSVDGEVYCKDGEIEGKVEGTVKASELMSLRSSARIEGDIETNKLSIEEGAVFTGNCTMGSSGASESDPSKESRAKSNTGAGTQGQEGPEQQGAGEEGQGKK